MGSERCPERPTFRPNALPLRSPSEDTAFKVNREFKYRASLADTSLPEILFSIDRFRVGGVIEARRDDQVKQVYLRDGYVIHARSSVENDRLGSYLERAALLQPKQVQTLAELRNTTNRRFGVLLVERGLLSPAAVFDAIRTHVEEIVWSLFDWRDGEVTFELGEFQEDDVVQIQLPLRRVIFQGIKRSPDPKALVARLGSRDTLVEPCYHTEDLIELGLTNAELQVLYSVDGHRTLYRLLSQREVEPAATARLLYAYHVLQLIKVTQVGDQEPIKITFRTAGDRLSNS